MPLTDRAIKAAKPEKRTRKLFDSGGLYLEISPAGGKWWRIKYRFAGKEKRISLGVYPRISLKEARQRRDDARRSLDRGVDDGCDILQPDDRALCLRVVRVLNLDDHVGEIVGCVELAEHADAVLFTT